MRYTLQNEQMTAVVDSLGAELVSVVRSGKERLWQNDNGSWSGHAPLLFPICGYCRMTVNGVTYPLPRHGFTRRKEFTLVRQTESSVTLTLAADEETRAVYPFDFIETATYTLCGDEVQIDFTVENPADRDLYFSCGAHDSFRLYDALQNYKIVFEKEEHLVHNFHDDRTGGLTGEKHDYGKVKEFALPADYLQHGATLIFDHIRSRKVQLCKATGELAAEVRFEGFPHLLLWRPHEANMICIEPWHNLPDPHGKPDCEFSRKEGVIRLAPGEKKTFTRSVRYAENA